jgi:transcriptional regulator with XRE-family HTH domain
MDIRSLFGGNMRRLRLAAGLSQDAVAVRMDVDRAHVSSMERGQQNVTLAILHEAAQAIGVKPAALLEESAEPPPPIGTKAPRTRRAVRPRQ